MTTLYGVSDSPSEQRSAFRAGEVPVAVYGLGKMGLPLAVVYAETCGAVTGVDIDPAVVDQLNAGECHVDGEVDLPEAVAEQVERGALCATTDGEGAAAAAAIHVVIVPTLLTERNDPDLSILESALHTIATGLAPGDLVVIECTVPPGTTRDLVVPLLTRESGLEPGTFGVAVCPERTLSGRALADVRGGHPKVVGGIDAESCRVAELIYGELTTNEVVPVGDSTTAETVKLFEGVYRDVNIALANELATLADELGVDVKEAIDVANTQPYSNIHSPGPGVGGHCIPYYPYFVMNRVSRQTPLLKTARDVNDSMPGFTTAQVVAELESAGRDVADSTVLVAGVTYRPGVAETRATPARPIIDSLAARGARVLAVDPMLTDDGLRSFGASPVSLSAFLAGTVDPAPDAVVVVTPHAEFDAVDWDAFEDIVIVDGRDSVGETHHPVYVLGRGRRDRQPAGDDARSRADLESLARADGR